ncbi:hypothetical protein BDR22DRAFT_964025 [Usnea florida]
MAKYKMRRENEAISKPYEALLFLHVDQVLHRKRVRPVADGPGRCESGTEALVSKILDHSRRRPLRSALKVFCHPQTQCHGGLNRSLRPNPLSNELISSAYKEAQTTGSDLEERRAQAESRKQPAAEEHASRLLNGFQPGAEDKVFSRWPLNEDDCLSAGLGTKCDPFCAYCDMKDVCIPCFAGTGPSILEYTGGWIVGDSTQSVGDDDICRKEVDDEAYVEGVTEEEDFFEEVQDDDSLNDSGNEGFFQGFRHEEPVDDENGSEKFVDEEIRDLRSPQSLWPFSRTFWTGILADWEQGLGPFSIPKFDNSDCSDFVLQPLSIGLQSSGADIHDTCGKTVLSSHDVSQLPIAYSLYPPFWPDSHKLHNQTLQPASQYGSAERRTHLTSGSLKLASRAESRMENEIDELWPEASHEQGADQARATVSEDRPLAQTARTKDSRRWGKHEKAAVTVLMREVIAEGTHSLTEERWKVISRRLDSRYSIDRTWTAVKNYWNRQGRRDTNIDERKIKKPNRMTTGVQDPESRRRARHLKRKDADGDSSNDLVDLENGDGSNSAPPSKHRRLTRAQTWKGMDALKERPTGATFDSGSTCLLKQIRKTLQCLVLENCSTVGQLW